jgi:amino acid transporter/mannitol/fructose-specific phosphotransferase system IIA component (Ntr-type)
MISELQRKLKLVDIFCIATGAMISSGLFILPGLAHAKAGPAVIISYFLAGLFAMTGMLSQAELVTAMPKAGGTYFYVTRSLGPAIGTVDGLITWFSISLKSAFALFGMAAFIIPLTGINIHIISLCLALCFLVINYFGVGKAGKVQRGLVFILVLLLITYIIKGIPAIKIHNLVSFAPGGLSSIFATAGFVFISYGGILKVASVAEETTAPSKNIPYGMIFSLLVVTFLYIFVVFITTGVLESSVLDTSLTPLTDAASVFMGNPGKIIMSLAAILAFVSTANAGIMAASRYPLALSRDGLLPEIFGKISKRFGTPFVSLIFTGIFVIAALFLNLTMLVKAASTVLILSFIFACLAVITLRESKLQNYRPSFKTPLYPWTQIIGIIGFIFLLLELGTPALLTTGGLILIGFSVYWFYGRKRVDKEFALIHLVERIMDKKLARHVLESELKDIVRERDEITRDRFDQIIEKCPILDIEERIELDEFMRLSSDVISYRINKNPKEIYDALLKREKETSTVISPFLAIPHIVIDGDHVFEILVARCKKGILFSNAEKYVKAVFILIGTADERNFHLKALSAIAQIVQNPKFEEMWIKAKDKNNLCDIILLGERTRH